MADAPLLFYTKADREDSAARLTSFARKCVEVNKQRKIDIDNWIKLHGPDDPISQWLIENMLPLLDKRHG